MTSRHEIGHAIAGLLGVIGFPIAALLLSSALAQTVTQPRAIAMGVVNFLTATGLFIGRSPAFITLM